MKALIVDSDSATRRALTRALETLGHETLGCATSAEAQAALQNDFYSLIFANWDEDAAAAVRLCRWLRSKAPDGPIWIIALQSKAGLSQSALDDGANDVLLKPIDAAAAMARIAFAERQVLRLRERQEEQKAAAYRAGTRAQQQVAVAALGQWALTNVELEMLIGQAILFVAQTLEVEFCVVFELLSRGDELVLRDGMGWPEGSVGLAWVPAGAETAEGRAIHHEPVIVQDWAEEKRFAKPPLHQDNQIRSSLLVVIPGAVAAFGVLAAHSARARVFTEDDLHFLQAVAVVLSLAIERRRSEESIQRLAAFPRCNPNPILELNSQGELTYANQAAEAMARSLGRDSVLELLPEGYAELARSCLASNESRQQQFEVAQRTVAWSFFPIPGSRVVHCYAEEITNRLTLENQLRQLQKMECIGQLAAGLAHDFNNVLTIIRGHTELLLADKALAPKRVSSLGKVLGAVERASGLTRQLLTFSRRQFAQTTALDLNECLANVLKMLDHMLGEHIELIFEPSRDLPAILGDSGMLDQVVMNLAVNARDAMPKGGRLVLTTSLLEVDEVYVQRRSEARIGKFVCLSVTDTGMGMDAATLSHIFEPFFTTKGVGKGTGLGLATVYGIVQQHQGWIEVTSRLRQGTTFLIFLPCSNVPVVQDSDVSQSSSVRGGNETILLVEDEPTLRELARMILQSYGYEVIEANSGFDAVKVWSKEKERIDLLLTDLVMPEGMTGMELGRKLTSEKPSLKVVYASGYSSEVMGKEGIQQEICFLPKPYAAQSLARIVRDSLDCPAKAPSA